MKSFAQLVLCMLMALTLTACDEAGRKALRDLVKDVSTNAQETETAGRVLQAFAVFEQAQGLSDARQCQAAADIYCAAFRMVRDNCNDQTEFCQTVANALYGGSFPVFGFRACVSEAADQCQRLSGQRSRLHRLCLELRRQCGAGN